LPMTMPVRGTSVRASSGKIDSPKITPRLSAVVTSSARRAIPNSPGTAGARRRMVTAANTTIPATHSQDQRSGASSSSTSPRARPTARSWTEARSTATALDPSSPTPRHHDSPMATPTRTSAASRPTHVTSPFMLTPAPQAPCRSCRAHHPALVHADDVVGDAADLLGLLGHPQHRDAVLPQVVGHPLEAAGGVGVERRGRLVAEEHLG